MVLVKAFVMLIPSAETDALVKALRSGLTRVVEPALQTTLMLTPCWQLKRRMTMLRSWVTKHRVMTERALPLEMRLPRELGMVGLKSLEHQPLDER